MNGFILHSFWTLRLRSTVLIFRVDSRVPADFYKTCMRVSVVNDHYICEFRLDASTGYDVTVIRPLSARGRQLQAAATNRRKLSFAKGARQGAVALRIS